MIHTDTISEPSVPYPVTPADSFGLLDKAIMVLKPNTPLRIAMATTIEALYGALENSKEKEASTETD